MPGSEAVLELRKDAIPSDVLLKLRACVRACVRTYVRTGRLEIKPLFYLLPAKVGSPLKPLIGEKSFDRNNSSLIGQIYRKFYSL